MGRKTPEWKENRTMKNNTQRTIRTLSTVLTLAVLLALARDVALAGDDANSKILPPKSHPYGKTYGEWSAEWWQWALGIPVAQNPVTDTTGQYAGVGQRGQVWFLGGSFGSPASVERSFTVPTGMGLFLPVYLWIFGATVGDCEPSNPGVICDIPTLRQSAEAAAKSILVMEVSIDGTPVKDLQSYYAASPSAFSVTLPADNVLESLGLPDPAGTYYPQVSAGYWLMLAPLNPGTHAITVHLIPNPAYGSEQWVAYTLKVQPKGKGHGDCGDD